jgi:uncharacterized lipoprotein YehR (DUF1307 family)
MTYRKITALLLAAVMMLSLCACGSKKAVVCTDVDQTAWYYKYVDTAIGVGIATGYDDGTYKPLRYVSAGEFVKMVAKADGAAP